MVGKPVPKGARRAVSVIAGAAVIGLGAAALGQAAFPSFTGDQAGEGRLDYLASCAACHGAALQGGSAPALSGPIFQRTWTGGTRNLRDLYEVVARQMPQNAPGSLPEAQDLAITAYLLSENGYPAGDAALRASGLDVALAPPPPVAATPAGPGPDGFAFGPPPQRPKPSAPEGPLPAAPPTVAAASTAAPNQNEIEHISPADWLTYNRDYPGDRYSPLNEINVGNVKWITPTCAFQLGEVGFFENSPLVYRGRMFVTTNHKIVAINAATCELIWGFTYVPQGAEHFPAGRGMALYDGKLFRGTSDGYLLALDAATGKLLWQAHVDDSALGYCISGAPVAFDGRVFVGECGGDSGIRGHVFAFDAASGKPLWTFDTVPTGNEPGAETWGGGGEHGGGPSWSSMAVDTRRKLLLVPVGNPGPDFNGLGRPGANLYTNSVVALDVASGKLAWYVQQVPHDTHDWDTAAAPAIYDRAGRSYMAVVSKNGYLFLYDRSTRKLLSMSPTTGDYAGMDTPLSLDHPVNYCPGSHGQWNGAGYAPDAGMLFVGAEQRCETVQLTEPHYLPGQGYYSGHILTPFSSVGIGWIHGYDAATGKIVWTYRSPKPISAAMTPTAGGLLLTGDTAGYFLAMDERTGRVLYRFMTGGAIAGGVTSYAVGGKQYVAVPSGAISRDVPVGIGAATIFVFSLP